MPIKLPSDLPAFDVLTREGVMVMSDEAAMRQDIRPLRIGLLDLMPMKIATENQFARLIGATLKEVISDSTSEGQTSDAGFRATLIVGGQIEGGPPRLFLIYPEGNFVEATEDTPFFQIGETKYGKPILVRTYDPSMSFNDAAKLLLVSFDSTVKANLSVGLPFDLITYEKDTFQVHKKIRIEQDDPMYHSISTGWGDALRAAFDLLPSYEL